MLLQCDCCGQSFNKKPARIARSQRHYCSHECRIKGEKRSEQERFWSFVNKTDSCWLWTGCLDKDGYGDFFSAEWGTHRAPRVAWVFTNGPIPKGLNVLHNCPGGDNRACVNPAHLWLGTVLDNNRDCARKGKKSGELNPNHTFTSDFVRELRRDFLAGEAVAPLANRHGLNYYAVWSVVHRKTWRHIL